MAFKDILNKGVGFLQEKVGDAKQAAIEKKNAIAEFDLLKTKSNKLGPLNPYVVNNPDPQPGKETMILNACLTISVENAKFVNKLIPITETIIDVKTSKEAQTIIEYIFVATDKKIWVLNKNSYMTYEYGTVPVFEVVNKGVMSQSVNFDNKAFVIDGSETDVKRFMDIVMNANYRMEIVNKKLEYLCGVTPARQILNNNFAGVTFGVDNTVVLHNDKINQKVNISDISMIQLLINDSVVISRGLEDSGSITSSPMEARKMSVKVTFQMNEFTIEVMKQNMMNTTYKREDSTYITNYDFAKSIVDALTEAIKK